MPRFSPFLVEVRSALTARTLVVSDESTDCAVVLERVLARRRREARSAVDPVTGAALEAEAERVEKILALARGARPLSPQNGPHGQKAGK